MPRTRFLASTITLVADTGAGPRGLAVNLVPTAAGDPLLRDLTPPASADEIVLTEAVADTLEAAPGDTVTAIVRYEADDTDRAGATDTSSGASCGSSRCCPHGWISARRSTRRSVSFATSRR